MPKRKRYHMPQFNRFTKARALVQLNAVKTLRTDRSNRIINALVPGSNAKTYEVIARREGRNYIETECLLQTGAGHLDCKGGLSSVCYHAIAVLLTSARDNGLDAAICPTEQIANRRKRINGNVYMLRSKHAPGNPLWLVCNRHDLPDDLGAGGRSDDSSVEQESLAEREKASDKALGY